MLTNIELAACIAHVPIFHRRPEAAVDTAVFELVLKLVIDLAQITLSPALWTFAATSLVPEYLTYCRHALASSFRQTATSP